MQDNVKKFLELIEKNPDLPIVPIVSGEICGDTCYHWLGSFGYAYVDEYVIGNTYDEKVLFKSDDDVFDTLENCLSAEEFDKLPDDESDCRKYYNELPWNKAILVFIETMD